MHADWLPTEPKYGRPANALHPLPLEDRSVAEIDDGPRSLNARPERVRAHEDICERRSKVEEAISNEGVVRRNRGSPWHQGKDRYREAGSALNRLLRPALVPPGSGRSRGPATYSRYPDNSFR